MANNGADKETRDGVRRQQKIPGPLSGIEHIAWSPRGQVLASLSRAGSLQLWDTESGQLLKTLDDPSRRKTGVTWSPDGKYIASNSNELIRVWSVEGGEIYREFEKVNLPVTSLAWSPDGHTLASTHDDGGVRLWDVNNAVLFRTLHGHTESTGRVAWSPDGRLLASCSKDKTIRLWRENNGELLHTIPVASDETHIAWTPDGSALASASKSQSIQIWEARTGRNTNVLEGHTAEVTGLSFSPDGKVLASASSGEYAIRLWRRADWTMVSAASGLLLAAGSVGGLLFHPREPVLALVGRDGLTLHVWDLDIEAVLGTAPTTESVNYTTAKIALVGNSGVGKTGIGWRLAHGEFREQSSTHGQQFWVIEELSVVRADNTQCEAVLWDLAGQPDYRLLHALFLDDVDLALLVFDPTDRQDPLKGVEFWLKQLSRSQGRPCRTILVGARVDRGSSLLTREELEKFCEQQHIGGGYVGTSARTGEGLEELMERVRTGIPWDEMAATITTTTFKRTKEYVLGLKESVERKENIVSLPVLRAQLEATDPEWEFSDTEMMAAVRHLATHGYVTILRMSSGEETILLSPDLLINLAASFVLEARRNPRGLGVLDEDRLLHGDYYFPELLGLSGQEREILLDAATILFLEHNICFRETFSAQTLLVFPSLINQKRPIIDEVKTVEGHSYIVTGAVENIYAALVVLLGYTNTFTRTNQWQNQAQYEMSPGEVCGFHQVQEHEGEIELTLYYRAEVPQHTRLLFQGLFEKFLSARDVTLEKYPPVICPECDYRQERAAVVKRSRAGKDFLFCDECGSRIELLAAGEEVSLSRRDKKKLEVEQSLTNLRTAFESALVRVKGIVRDEEYRDKPPRCFISYAWGEPQQERWVGRLAADLKNSGIEVVLDQLDNQHMGSSVTRFISRITGADFILVVGTPLYLRKYENEVSASGSVVAAEVDLIELRLTGTEGGKKSVIPLLLEGEVEVSLPPLLRTRVYADFREEGAYLATLFDLVLSIYKIPTDHPAIGDLRQSIREASRALILKLDSRQQKNFV